MKCIFSVDVEDWFHILEVPSAPEMSEWSSLPSCIDANFRKLLDIFDEKEVKVTCFFLGWVAEKYPKLVKEAFKRGHELASHGYSHSLIYNMKPSEFSRDIERSKRLLEDLCGAEVGGFRATGFSVTERTPWYFDRLIEAGYRYDSSVFPARRGHGGMDTADFKPGVITGESGSLLEFPISMADVFGKSCCFFGGGYLRLFPYFIIKRMAKKVLEEERPVIFYIHPREIDPGHPHLAMPAGRRFKSYVNLSSTMQKLERILEEFEIVTFDRFIKENCIPMEKYQWAKNK